MSSLSFREGVAGKEKGKVHHTACAEGVERFVRGGRDPGLLARAGERGEKIPKA